MLIKGIDPLNVVFENLVVCSLKNKGFQEILISYIWRLEAATYMILWWWNPLFSNSWASSCLSNSNFCYRDWLMSLYPLSHSNEIMESNTFAVYFLP